MTSRVMRQHKIIGVNSLFYVFTYLEIIMNLRSFLIVLIPVLCIIIRWRPPANTKDSFSYTIFEGCAHIGCAALRPYVYPE